jgi:hypothetical protein
MTSQCSRLLVVLSVQNLKLRGLDIIRLSDLCQKRKFLKYANQPQNIPPTRHPLV